MLEYALLIFAFRSACIYLQHPTLPADVVGPGGASSLYALPLLLSCMSFTCIWFVCRAILRHTHPHTHKAPHYCMPGPCFLFVCLALASCLYVLPSSRAELSFAGHNVDPKRSPVTVRRGSASRVSLCIGVTGVVVAGAVVGMMVVVVVVVALVVGTSTGAVVVLPPPRTTDAGMTYT